MIKPRVVVLLWIATALLPAVNLLAQQSPRALVEAGRAALDRGVLLYQEDQLYVALESLERAVELNPSFAEGWLLLSQTYYWLNDLPAAKTAHQRAAGLSGFSADVELTGAKIFGALGEWGAAGAAFDRVLAREPNHPEALLGREILRLRNAAPPIVTRSLAALHARYPQNRRLTLTLALLAHQSGDRTAAERYIDLSVRSFPYEPSVHLLAARVALEAADYAGADYHARNALALRDALPDALSILARSAVGREDAVAAVRHLEEIIALQPGNPLVWYDRGVALEYAGNSPAAIESLERALRLRPDLEPAHIALDNILLRSTDIEHPARARIAAPYLERAKRLQDRFLSRQAERALRRGLLLHPFNTELRIALAELYNQNGFRARLVQELEIAQRLGADSQYIRDALEMYRYALQDSVARRWDVDQFTVARQRERVGVYTVLPQLIGAQSATLTAPVLPETLVPAALADHGARYLRTLLNGVQHIDAIEDPAGSFVRPIDRRADVLARARADRAVFAVLWHFRVDEPYALAAVEVVETATGRSLVQERIVRTGNGRMLAAIDEAAAIIAGAIAPRGTVLARRFERVLLSLGKIDGLTVDQRFELHEGATVAGTVTITAVDDLVAEGRYQPRSDGIDRLRVGQTALLAPIQETPAAPAEAQPARRGLFGRQTDAPAPEVEQTALLQELMKRLLRIR